MIVDKKERHNLYILRKERERKVTKEPTLVKTPWSRVLEVRVKIYLPSSSRSGSRSSRTKANYINIQEELITLYAIAKRSDTKTLERDYPACTKE